MQELIAHIAGSLVDRPEQIALEHQENGDTITIKLKVAREDLGKVIGKQGRTARAMRSLLAAAAIRHGLKTRLDIME